MREKQEDDTYNTQNTEKVIERKVEKRKVGLKKKSKETDTGIQHKE